MSEQEALDLAIDLVEQAADCINGARTALASVVPWLRDRNRADLAEVHRLLGTVLDSLSSDEPVDVNGELR